METNRHCHGHLDRIDGGHLLLPEVIESEIFVFLAITLQMGHCIGTNWQTAGQITNQFHTRFYSDAMKWDRYIHILFLLQFTENNKEHGMTEENSARLRKLRNLSEILNKTFQNFQPIWTSEFRRSYCFVRRRVISPQYIAKEHKRFGIKINKTRDETVYSTIRQFIVCW